ncbi:MAG: MmgE/PrpD family protein [Acidimicrobiia bacterium]
MTESPTQQIAGFAARQLRTALDPEVSAATRRSIVDTLGVSIAAVNEPTVGVVASAVVGRGGVPEASVLGFSERLPAASAALVNGTMAHALDFDDTHLPSVLHPSASVVPAVLAVAEAEGSPGADIETAIAVGIEVTCRLGMAAYDPKLRNSIFFERGLHATSICGTIGAAVAVALLHGADKETVSHAIGIAASMGSGLIEANRTGGTIKRVHCGWAAHSGITAAEFATAGLTGPPTVLEGRFGFFEAFTGGFYDRPSLVGALGEKWELLRLFTKPYPTNHFTHAGIDAAIKLRQEGVNPDSITAMRLGVPAPVLRTIAEPIDSKAAPESGYSARFSGPFTVATALLGGEGLGVSAADFSDDAVRDPQRLAVSALVECYADEQSTRDFPNQFPGVLSIELNNGTRLEHRVTHTRGGPENPLSTDELELKFRLNVEPQLGSTGASQVLDAVNGLSKSSSYQRLVPAFDRSE